MVFLIYFIIITTIGLGLGLRINQGWNAHCRLYQISWSISNYYIHISNSVKDQPIVPPTSLPYYMKDGSIKPISPVGEESRKKRNLKLFPEEDLTNDRIIGINIPFLCCIFLCNLEDCLRFNSIYIFSLLAKISFPPLW